MLQKKALTMRLLVTSLRIKILMVFELRSQYRTMKGGQYARRHPPLRLQYLETESIKNCILKLRIGHARTKYRVIARACAAERDVSKSYLNVKPILFGLKAP